MKNKKLINWNSTLAVILASAAIGWMCWSVGNTCNAQTPPANPSSLSPDLQEVVTLSQKHMNDDVITTYIKNSGKSYNLSSDDILYLNSQGVSQGVISALQTASSANQTPAPVASAPATTPPTSSQPAPVQIIINQNTPPSAQQPTPQVAQIPPAPSTEAPEGGPEINFNYFHDQLAPFGTWVDVGGVMYWHPDQAINANPDWRPYYDMGQWVQTDNGLYWQSEYTWGDIPFHYGRWVRNPGYGWLWAPDYTWGPAWVFWRHAEGDAAIGWAPLPVGAVFVDGVFMFNGVRVGVDFDFGLREDCFTFVGYDHFHEGFFRMRGHELGYHIGRERLHGFYGRSVIRNEFRKDEHGRFVNNGIGRDRIEHLTHVEHSNFEERHPVGDRKALEVARNHQPGHTGNSDVHGPAHPGNSDVHGPEHPGKTGGQSPASASVNKVFRPPPPKPAAPVKPVATPAKQNQAQPEKNQKKQ